MDWLIFLHSFIHLAPLFNYPSPCLMVQMVLSSQICFSLLSAPDLSFNYKRLINYTMPGVLVVSEIISSCDYFDLLFNSVYEILFFPFQFVWNPANCSSNL